MRIRRTLPPTVAPIYCRDIVDGLIGILHGKGEIDRFEGELRKYFGVKHCFTISSGRAALTVILRALNEIHPERTVVVIPAYTCYSVAASVVRAGLSLRLCDVDENTLDFDYVQLENIIKGQSADAGEILAIIPTHLFGLPSDIDRLKTIIADLQIFIIEDAAQAFGGSYKKNKLGTLGDVGFFSLGRGKPITTAGGGIVVTDRKDIASGIESQITGMKECHFVGTISLIFKALLMSLFVHPGLYWFPKKLTFLKIGETLYDDGYEIGGLASFQAGLARKWLGKIKRMRQERSKRVLKFIAFDYSDKYYSFVSEEDELPDLLRFPLLFRDADLRKDGEHMETMDRLGIVPSYSAPISRVKELSERFRGELYPGAERLAEQLMTLPVHLFVSEDDVSEIMNILR